MTACHLPVLKSVLNLEAFLGLVMRKDYVHVVDLVVAALNVTG